MSFLQKAVELEKHEGAYKIAALKCKSFTARLNIHFLSCKI